MSRLACTRLIGHPQRQGRRRPPVERAASHRRKRLTRRIHSTSELGAIPRGQTSVHAATCAAHVRRPTLPESRRGAGGTEQDDVARRRPAERRETGPSQGGRAAARATLQLVAPDRGGCCPRATHRRVDRVRQQLTPTRSRPTVANAARPGVGLGRRADAATHQRPAVAGHQRDATGSRRDDLHRKRSPDRQLRARRNGQRQRSGRGG